MSRRNSKTSPTRLVISKGRSMGKTGYFMTSVVPGLDPKRAFFPVAGRANNVASVNFRQDHADRASSAGF